MHSSFRQSTPSVASRGSPVSSKNAYPRGPSECFLSLRRLRVPFRFLVILISSQSYFLVVCPFRSSTHRDPPSLSPSLHVALIDTTCFTGLLRDVSLFLQSLSLLCRRAVIGISTRDIASCERDARTRSWGQKTRKSGL